MNALNGHLHFISQSRGPAPAYLPQRTLRLDMFDPSTKTWSRGPDLDQNLHIFKTAVLGGKIYLVGGLFDDGTPTGGARSKAVHIFDGIRWSSGPPLPHGKIC